MRAESDVQFGVSSSSNAKKGTVDVHRGDTYQFAYFFRQTEPHAVLIKTRNFVLDTRPVPPVAPPPPADVKGKSRKRSAAKSAKGNKRRSKASKKAVDQDGMEKAADDVSETIPHDSDNLSAAPRRSSRARKPAAGSYREDDDDDIEMGDQEAETDPAYIDEAAEPVEDVPLHAEPLTLEADETTGTGSSTVIKDETEEPSLDPGPSTADAGHEGEAEITTHAPQVVIEIEDDEEPKPKLALQLKYRGFSISGRCLCVVVEPWPTIRSASRAPSLAPMASTTVRAPSIAPPDFRRTGSDPGRRSRTPLFLPDYDERERSETPGPSRFRTLPPVPLFNDPAPADDGFEYDMDDMGDDGELMQFSQILSSTGRGGGGMEDDDDFDGAVFFADADEAREL
ncbi:hypothetical protein BV25DRAFT_1986363 [Artomyces pyxidatus]|uniref:Uncharacterized protein n=1 Tax=Artomyces pyxidatus TaxID=48021 RepID=A0ACB8TK99_9AGAM|nr:hypothetical protein BV25DRAFT_1986363 [Artomyces pyxidatus]